MSRVELRLQLWLERTRLKKTNEKQELVQTKIPRTEESNMSNVRRETLQCFASAGNEN